MPEFSDHATSELVVVWTVLAQEPCRLSHLIPSWWNYVGRIRRRGLAGGGMPLGESFEVSEAHNITAPIAKADTITRQFASTLQPKTIQHTETRTKTKIRRGYSKTRMSITASDSAGTVTMEGTLKSE